ncbi:MAG: hypothetical protein ACOCVM_05145 [Desulfovibrionaceae bacterium]
MAYEIILVKLINGDLVLGKESEDKSKITDPALLQTVPSQQGLQMIILPFGYPFENEISGEIDTKHVLYEFKTCPEELKSKYMEASSNLTLSSAGDLKNLNLGGAAGGAGGSNLTSILKK